MARRDEGQERHQVINIGTSSMIVILMGLSFGVIAALAVSSAKNNYNLSEAYASHTTEFYEASNKAYEHLANTNYADEEFTVPLNDKQILEVEVDQGQIVTWRLKNVSNWDSDSTLPVLQ